MQRQEMPNQPELGRAGIGLLNLFRYPGLAPFPGPVSLGVDATCVSRSVSRVESRITEDKAMKKVVDEIVAVIQNSKYHA